VGLARSPIATITLLLVVVLGPNTEPTPASHPMRVVLPFGDVKGQEVQMSPHSPHRLLLPKPP
jgi:hypothetical protein